MVKYTIVDDEQLDADLTEVANAIREKAGTSDDLDFPSGFVSAVQSISGGEDTMALFATGTLTEYTSDEVTEMIGYAFARNTTLAKVNLPNWTKGGAYAFQNCSGLTSVKCTGLQVVPEACFFNCSALERVEFGEALAYMGSAVFKNCSALETVIIRKNGKATLGSTGAFEGTPIASGTGYIYVPNSQIATYTADSAWSTFVNQIRAIEDYPDITSST